MTDLLTIGPARLPSVSRPRRRTWALVVVLVLALGLLGWVGWRAAGDQVAPNGEVTAPGERTSIMAEAARMTTLAMSWRAASSQADIEAATAVMTKKMVAAYQKTLPDPSARAAQAQRDVKVSAVLAPLTNVSEQPKQCTPQVCAVGLISVTPSRAVALLYVNQTASAKGTTNTVVSPTWERVTLVKVDGRWRLDEMVAP